MQYYCSSSNVSYSPLSSLHTEITFRSIVHSALTASIYLSLYKGRFEMKTIKNIRPANKTYQIIYIIYVVTTLTFWSIIVLIKFHYILLFSCKNCFPAKKNNVVVKFHYSYDCKMGKKLTKYKKYFLKNIYNPFNPNPWPGHPSNLKCSKQFIKLHWMFFIIIFVFSQLETFRFFSVTKTPSRKRGL